MERATKFAIAGLLTIAGALSTIQVSTNAAAAVSPPNVILITTDDQSVTDLEHMPFTRRLLGEAGVTFTNAVVPYPLCCPARAVLLTGQLNHNNGVLANSPPMGGYEALRPKNGLTLPVWLRTAGYETTFVGKYLNGYGSDPTEIPDGWTNWNGSVRGVYDYFGNQVNHNGQVVDHTGEYIPEVTQSVTEEAIRSAAGRAPFFIWQSNVAPHGACHPTEGGCTWGLPMVAAEDESLFSDLPLVTSSKASFNERVVTDKPEMIATRRALTRRDVARLVRSHRARVRSLQAVDRNVRATVELLSELGELDNTLIVFTSDNGFMLGEHRARGKTLPYEPSLTVPLLMRGPGVPAGVEIEDTVALVDVAPTIADLTGAVPLLPQDGASLLPVANGAPGYGAVSIEAGHVLRDDLAPGEFLYQGVRTDRWVYVEYPKTDEYELYDLQRDPDQLDNLAYRPTHSATRRALSVALDRLRDCAAEECRSGAGRVPEPLADQGPVHPDQLASVGTATQVVTVTAASWSDAEGTAVAWQKRGRSWRAVRGPIRVQLGTRGFSRPGERRHLSGKTPTGAFGLDGAIGFRSDPGTRLPYRRLDRDDYWPFDPASPRTYNVFQPSRSPTATWRTKLSERWWEHRDRFRYGIVVDDNLPTRVRLNKKRHQWEAGVPAAVGQGSLVLHGGERLGRQGWIAVPQADLRWLLTWAPADRDQIRLIAGPVDHLIEQL